MKKNNLNLIIFIFILALLLSPLSVFAIGQITEPIIINNALRGSDYTKKLTLLNSTDEEVIYQLKASGEIASWASFFELNDEAMGKPIVEIKVPASLYINLTAKFAIPEDAANKEYKGKVLVVYTPPVATTSDETSVNLSQSVGREVTINVSDEELIDFNVSLIPHSYDIKSNEALSIRIIYDNQSNISIKPQIDLKIKNIDQTVYSAIFPYPDNEPAVKPGTQHEISALTIPTNNIADGRYRAELKFAQGNNEELNKNFTFSLGISQEINKEINKEWLVNPYLIIFILIVSAIMVVATIMLKKKQKSKTEGKTDADSNNNKNTN